MSNNGDSNGSPCVLEWELKHLGDDDFDAELVKFDNWEETLNLVLPTPESFPNDIYFEANFRVLRTTDYPYNDVGWPIMSKKMRKVLKSCGEFAHQEVPVTMLDDTVRSADRFDEKGEPRSDIVDHRFKALYELDEIDAFDWDKSTYDVDKNLPGFAFNIRKLVLIEPEEGFPPLFRISATPVALFVSGEARLALEKEEVQGVLFVSVSDFRG